ncbi:hypothetical protein FB451DRAFT_1360023 [Mycena latifolia]|nr:hypothetical protein FB451DRAFT_1360023 [Mycena latifolia]
MYSEHSDHATPFLQQPASDMGSDLHEKPFDPRPFDAGHVLPQRGGFSMKGFLSKLLGWPAIVICGQIILQVAAWTFFVVVESKGFIALPYASASWAKDHARKVTLISTLISTILASCSSFLFSFGVRRSIALYLGRPMSLAAFVATVSISARSLVLDPRKWKWSAMSIALVILTGVQTSGWSTLLTPVGIVIQTPVSGTELDLSSLFLRQMQSSGGLDYCIQNSSFIPAFTVGQTQSGYARASNFLQYPATFTLMDQTFNISAAGILPVTLGDVNASTWFPDATVLPSTLQGLSDLPDALSLNYSMLQQGFSVDVTCAFHNLSADTTPSLTLLNDTVKDWNTLDISLLDPIMFTRISSTCAVPDHSGLNATNAYTMGEAPSYILMIACGPANNNYTLVFVSAGEYEAPTTVCTLSPKITKVVVDYSDPFSFSGTIGTTTAVEGAVPDPDGPAGFYAVSTISNMLFFAQAIASNIMGDQINSVLTDVSDDDFDTFKLALTEEYIRGVAEYSGSVFRACLSAKNQTFPDGVPANMTIATSGIIFSQTVGWNHLAASSVWVLIPGSLVAIVTIVFVLVAVAQHAGDPPRDVFDPSNAMHLVAAAAAGGLNDAFTGTGEEDIQAAERVNVVLGSIPGRGPALIRTEDRERQFAFCGPSQTGTKWLEPYREQTIMLESPLESAMRHSQASVLPSIKVEPRDFRVSLAVVKSELVDNAPRADPVRTRVVQEDGHDVLEILSSDSEPDDGPIDSDVEVSQSLTCISSRSSSTPPAGIDPKDDKPFVYRLRQRH